MLVLYIEVFDFSFVVFAEQFFFDPIEIQFIAAFGFGIKQANCTVFETNDKIHIKQRVLTLFIDVTDRKMFAALPTVLMPPLDKVVALWCFEFVDKIKFGIAVCKKGRFFVPKP